MQSKFQFDYKFFYKLFLHENMQDELLYLYVSLSSKLGFTQGQKRAEYEIGLIILARTVV